MTCVTGRCAHAEKALVMCLAAFPELCWRPQRYSGCEFTNQHGAIWGRAKAGYAGCLRDVLLVPVNYPYGSVSWVASLNGYQLPYCYDHAATALAEVYAELVYQQYVMPIGTCVHGTDLSGQCKVNTYTGKVVKYYRGAVGIKGDDGWEHVVNRSTLTKLPTSLDYGVVHHELALGL